MEQVGLGAPERPPPEPVEARRRRAAGVAHGSR